jgi:hypothetical protein
MILAVVFLFVLICTTCTSEKTDYGSLCTDFWSLNKARSFDELANILIESRNTEYDQDKKIYNVFIYNYSVYDSSSRQYIKFPLYKDHSNWNEVIEAFNDCDDKGKMLLGKVSNVVKSEQELIKVYYDHTNRIISHYNKIVLPKEYHYGSVLMVQGRPQYNMITFKLSKGVYVYFFKYPEVLTKDYFKDILQNTTKLDNHWYYKIEHSEN